MSFNKCWSCHEPIGPAQEDTFSQVDPMPFGIFLVADGINQQFVDQFYIRWNYHKVVPEQDFAPFFHPLQTGL